MLVIHPWTKTRGYRQLIAAGCAVALWLVGAAAASANVFTPTGSMPAPRAGHAAILLEDGKVLIAGGQTTGGAAVASALLYDPNAGTFSPTGSLATARWDANSSILPDGRVLIAGGLTTGSVPLASAEIYDPAAGTFTAAAPMNVPRAYTSATAISDGRVIVPGGSNAGGPIASADVFDPMTETFSLATVPLGSARFAAAVVGLEDGGALVAGGNGSGSWLSASDVFSPSSSGFSATGAMPSGRDYAGVTLLGNGQVLIAGGYSGPSSNPANSLSSATLYDPDSGTFGNAGSMAESRSGPRAVTLPDGRAMVVGGGVGNDVIVRSSAEIYTPETDAFTATGSMNHARGRFSATRLADGRILVAGGTNTTEGFMSSAELYLSPVALTVGRTGNGSGQVTSDPGGIDCGSSCEAFFQSDDAIELTAAPDSGSTFVGWSGEECSGAGTCTVTMRGAQSVVAKFRAEKPLVERARGSGARSLPVSVACAGDRPCQLSITGLRRLRAKTGKPDGKTRPAQVTVKATLRRTVALAAGEVRTVRLAYTSYLKRTIRRAFSRSNPIPPKIRVTARDLETNAARTIVVYARR